MIKIICKNIERRLPRYIEIFKRIFSRPVIVLFILRSFSAYGQAADAINFYNIPKGFVFGTLKYELGWSSVSPNGFYKQEYLPSGQQLSDYQCMAIIELAKGDLSLSEVVRGQIDFLETRKISDKVCQYSVEKNSRTGEYILDFILSEWGAGQLHIIEWNIYHYKAYKDHLGNGLVCLFGLSHRAYDAAALPFLKNLKDQRQKKLKEFAAYQFPEVQLK